MANELALTAVLNFNNKTLSSAALLSLIAKTFTVYGANVSEGTLTVGTALSAIPLAGVSSSGGFAMFLNRDTTNYVTIYSASFAGTKLCRILPGEPALFRFDPTIIAPAWIANTSPVRVSYVILEP